MICPNCKVNISGANKKKHDGVYYHKQCPGKKTWGQKRREKKHGS